MQKNTMPGFLTFIVLAVFAAGCGVKAQTYVMTKERTDIAENGGNGGTIMGKAQYQAPEKKTRKVYVLEVSKPAGATDARKVEQVTTEQVPAESTTAVEAPAAPAGEFENESAPAPASASASTQEAVMYTVQKDDTLQKIAKKVYGSYGKWIKIYEANKEKLKNPNFVKPGTVLTIPAEK